MTTKVRVHKAITSEEILKKFKSDDKLLDLNAHLTESKGSYFLIRVDGDSMVNVNIKPNDLLLVDTDLPLLLNGMIAVVDLNGSMLVKKLFIAGPFTYLLSENPDYQPLRINEADDLSILGKVCSVIKNF